MEFLKQMNNLFNLRKNKKRIDYSFDDHNI